MYTALYRTERPEVFSEVLGQDHIVKILKHQIATGTTSHAYLFCGTRGTGKTTMARLLAKAVNCTCDNNEDKPCGKCANCEAIKNGTFIDVIEIDAASNNGVENIREINESVKFPPSVGKTKVYIIDEVHMLSTGAFNALLKTLEEPPENVMFILATTEPQKLPQTILSRCMKLDFRRVPETVMANGMKKICQDRGVKLEDDALKLLTANADGSVRDGLSILEQCLATGEKTITRDLILEFLGTCGDEFFLDLTDKILMGNLSEAMLLINNAVQEGKDVKQLIKDLTSHYRNLLIAKFVGNPEDMLNMSKENIDKLKKQSSEIDTEEISNAIRVLSKIINEARWSTQPRILLEMAIVEISGGNTKPVVKTAKPKDIRKKESIITEKKESSSVEKKETSDIEENVINNSGLKVEQVIRGDETAESNSQTETGDSNIDYDELWNNVIEPVATKQPAANVLKNSAKIIKIQDGKAVVGVSNFVAKMTLENNIELIEETLGELLKEKVSVTCEDMANVQQEEPKEDLKETISSKLGIEVEIK